MDSFIDADALGGTVIQVDEDGCLLVSGLEDWIKHLDLNGSVMKDKKTGVKFRVEVVD